jgi:NADPH-dependent F420 reductase
MEKEINSVNAGTDLPVVAIVGGTGDQGRGLARRWVAAGYKVIIGSRDPDRARHVAATLHLSLPVPAAGQSDSLVGEVSGGTNQEAAAAARIVVLTVPFAAQLATLKEIRDHLQPGTLLIDVTVPLEPAVGGRPTRLLGVWAGSAAEQAAETLSTVTGVAIVSAFQNVGAAALADLEHQVDCDIIVCGDARADRERVRPLVEAISGCRYLDGGVLANSRLVESWTAMLIGLNIRYRAHTGLRITGIKS